MYYSYAAWRLTRKSLECADRKMHQHGHGHGWLKSILLLVHHIKEVLVALCACELAKQKLHAFNSAQRV